MFRQMSASEPSKTAFRCILKWQCNPKLRQVPLGMCFPSQDNSILFSHRSTGSLRIRKLWTFPYAPILTFFFSFHKRLDTGLLALKGDILQNNPQRGALKITATVFKAVMVLSDASTTGERPSRVAEGAKATFLNLQFLFSVKNKKTKETGYNTLMGWTFSNCKHEETGPCQQSSAFPSVRVTLCKLLHFESLSLQIS